MKNMPMEWAERPSLLFRWTSEEEVELGGEDDKAIADELNHY